MQSFEAWTQDFDSHPDLRVLARRLRSTYITPHFLNWLADLVDPEVQRSFKLHLSWSTGRPKVHLDDIMKVVEAVDDLISDYIAKSEGKRVPMKKIYGLAAEMLGDGYSDRKVADYYRFYSKATSIE